MGLPVEHDVLQSRKIEEDTNQKQVDSEAATASFLQGRRELDARVPRRFGVFQALCRHRRNIAFRTD